MFITGLPKIIGSGLSFTRHIVPSIAKRMLTILNYIAWAIEKIGR
jgi:hypothetical protein